MRRAENAFVVLVGGLSLGAMVLGGCASTAKEAEPVAVLPRPVAPVASPVIPGEEIARYEASARGTLPFERFEFSRNNVHLNAVRQVPIEAGRQWPEPPRPRERPIIFQRWRQ